MVFPYFSKIVHSIPGGKNAQVFGGVMIMFSIAAAPILLKTNKDGRGGELFSQEKPIIVENIEEANRKRRLAGK